MYALTNGVRSRDSNFKLKGNIAEVLNLVVTIEKGVVKSLDWKNACIEMVCSFENCQETTFNFLSKTIKDKNCYIKTCKSSKETNNCDSKVYVTWEGNDREDRWCESDNYRITNLLSHSIKTYFSSATKVAD